MSDGLLQVPATGKRLFKDFQLHVEFLIPYRGPSGGNSGVYLQNCYEIQVFDSFGRERSPSGCGGIYVFSAQTSTRPFRHFPGRRSTSISPPPASIRRARWFRNPS